MSKVVISKCDGTLLGICKYPCHNNGTCTNPVDNECTCLDGFMGRLCDRGTLKTVLLLCFYEIHLQRKVVWLSKRNLNS